MASSKKSTNLEKILKNATYGWVSISRDYKKVIAQAKTLDELIKKIENKGNPDGVITRVTPGFSSYVG